MKRVNIAVIPPQHLPSSLKWIATEYKISKDSFFKEDELLVNELSTTDLYEKKFTLDIDKDDTFYAVTRFKYQVIDPTTKDPILENGNEVFKFGTPSLITPFKGNQEGVKVSDAIIKTPKVRLKPSHEVDNYGRIMITCSPFEMFSSIGKHKSTTWVIHNIEGKELYKREEDIDNLTEIELPEEFKFNESFIVYAKYHSDTNAESNFGTYVHMITTYNPKFDVEMFNELYKGIDAQFMVKVINYKFKTCHLKVEMDGNIISTHNNIPRFFSLPTGTYIINKLYRFIFTITDTRNLVTTIVIEKYCKDHNEKYHDRDYLDKYDYSGMIINQGYTNLLSYQLHNGTILSVFNNSRAATKLFYHNTRENNNLQIFGNLFNLPTNTNLIDPSTFIGEFLNGDVVIVFINNDKTVNKNPKTKEIKIATYTHNWFTDEFKLKQGYIFTDDELVRPGSICTHRQFLYYIDYHNVLGNRLVKLNPENGNKEEFNLPINVKHGISIVGDNHTKYIYLMGGTNDNISDYDLKHQRHNNKVYRFDVDRKEFTEVGNNLLRNVNTGIYQFHIAPRYGDKAQTTLGYTLFQTIDNNNTEVMADQSTYVLNLDTNTVKYQNNDHLDNLPYANTIIMNNGDVVRYASTDDYANKVYTYIANSRSEMEIDDHGNIIRDGRNLIIEENMVTTKADLCRYDKVIIRPGGKLILTQTGSKDEVYYSDTLVVTRDTVLNMKVEFIDKGYANILMACPEADLVFN